mgnify:CR=1 FL=1
MRVFFRGFLGFFETVGLGFFGVFLGLEVLRETPHTQIGRPSSSTPLNSVTKKQKKMPGRVACWTRNEFTEHRQGAKTGLQCKHCDTVLWSVNGSRTKKHITVCAKVPEEKKQRAKDEVLKPFDLKTIKAQKREA